MYLNSFNYFRALACVLVVAGHTLIKTGLIINTTFELTILNIITGGSILFVFISGFLFHHIYYEKFDYQSFISLKFVKLIIPYTFIGIFSISYRIYTKSYSSDECFFPFRPIGTGLYNEIIVPAVKYYFSGNHITTHWFIPFIFLTFLLSPLHIYFIKLNKYFQLFFIFVLSIVSIFIHRPIHNFNTLQSLIYYSPIYLLGIFCSINQLTIYEKLRNKEYLLLVIIVFIAAVEWVSNDFGSYEKYIKPNGVIDLMFIQKVFMCLFFTVFLHRFENIKIHSLQILASASYPIFLFHPILIKITLDMFYKLTGNRLSIDSWTIYFIFTFFIIVFCVIIIKFIKLLISNKSSYILGCWVEVALF